MVVLVRGQHAIVLAGSAAGGHSDAGATAGGTGRSGRPSGVDDKVAGISSYAADYDALASRHSGRTRWQV